MMLPTRYSYEGQPACLIEAMAFGLPAITTDFRGNAEIVIDGETGYLVDWRDTAHMAERIKELRNNPKLYVTMSRQARINYDRSFSHNAHLDAMQSLLA
jgi:glycosyltransferase involved in cell wall biosynthesis